MHSIKEVLKKYADLATKGEGQYKNYGMGNMTEAERETLKSQGLIVTKTRDSFGYEIEETDFWAVKSCGIIEYMNRGSDQIKVQTFHGKTDELISFQMDEYRSILQASKAKIIRDEIIDVPVRDCPV